MPDPDEPLESIKYIGPAQAKLLRLAGISDGTELRRLGADEAYARMLETGMRPHFIGYYALHMALQGRPWNDCRGKEKDAFRVRFDQLKEDRSAMDGFAELEAHLDLIGVGRRRVGRDR